MAIAGIFTVQAVNAADSIPAPHQVILKGKWMPSGPETEKALTAAVALVKKVAAQPKGNAWAEKYRIEGAQTIDRKLEHYAVQFIGQIRQGRKVIFCSFFPAENLEHAFPEWRKSEVVVDDGGYNFWNVDFDPETGRCGELQINGPG